MKSKKSILQKPAKILRDSDEKKFEKILDFEEIIMNKKTRTELENYLENPTQSLLICGESGVGLKTIALALAKKIAGGNRILMRPQLHPGQTKKNINVDDIRSLNKISAQKRRENFAIIIDEAEKMTNDAPQAFLKLLEEPGDGILYILTSHAPENLPLTILSRVQKIEILPENSRKILDNFPEKIDAKKRAQIEFLARNLPAKMTKLLTDKKYFADEVEKIELAKKFIAGNFYEKLKIISSINKRDEAQKLASAIAKLVYFMCEKSPENFAKKSMQQNIELLDFVLKNLAANGHAKLQLTFLATNWREGKGENV